MNNIILALDLENIVEAHKVIRDIDTSKIWGVKFNSLARYYGLPEILNLADWWNIRVMLDWKLFDIPSTIKRDIDNINSNDNIEIVTVCISALEGMIFQNTLEEEELIDKHKNRIAGITILTSEKLSGTHEFSDRCHVAQLLGVNYIVCPGTYVKRARELYSGNIICPGIRFKNNESHDQQKIIDPYDAGILGIDYMVIGRPIIESKDRNAMIDKINDLYKEGVNSQKEV